MLTAKHNITPEGSVLLPVSLFMHQEFLSTVHVDRTIRFYDGTATLLDANAIPMNVVKRNGQIVSVISTLGNQISEWLYRVPLITCVKLWLGNWPDIDLTKAIFVTFKDAKKDEVE